MSSSSYGRDHVAQIITFGTLQARGVLRDVGRVLRNALRPGRQALPSWCRRIRPTPVTLAAGHRRRAAAAGGARAASRSWRAPLAIAQKLEGLYRHASTHAAGIVIGDRPLSELVPLYRDPKSDMPVDPVQHEMGRAGRAW